MELNKDDLLMDELEQFMLAAEIEELKVKLAGDTEEDGTLLVKNKSDADFYLRQINKLKQQKEEINEFVDQEIERQLRLYQEYREDRMRPLDNQIAFYENALKTFAMNEYAETNKKTIKLPNGTLAIKKQQPKYVYNDEQVLEFLQENNYKDYIRTKAEVNKKDLKKNAIVNNNNELVIDGKVVQERSENNTLVYTFDKAGDYRIEVKYFNIFDEYETHISTYTVVEPYTSDDPVITSIHTNRWYTSFADTNTKVTAYAFFGTAPYQFSFNLDNGTLVQDFSESNEFLIEDSLSLGEHNVKVTVKDSNGKVATEVYSLYCGEPIIG